MKQRQHRGQGSRPHGYNRNQQQDSGRQRSRPPTARQVVQALELSDWSERWNEYRRAPHRTAPTYQLPLSRTFTALPLHSALPRAQSTLLTLLRTEKIGFNDFLAQRDVPNVHPECECGWVRQTPKHIVVRCPLLPGRESLWRAAGTPSYDEAINDPRGAAAITAWLLSNCGPHRLAQFTVAKEIFLKNKPRAAPVSPFRSGGRGHHSCPPPGPLPWSLPFHGCFFGVSTRFFWEQYTWLSFVIGRFFSFFLVLWAVFLWGSANMSGARPFLFLAECCKLIFWDCHCRGPA